MKRNRFNIGDAPAMHPAPSLKLPGKFLICALLIVLSACSRVNSLPAPPPAQTQRLIEPTNTVTSKPTAPPVQESLHPIKLSPHVTAMGGAVFDRDDNFFVGDADADLIYKFDPAGHMLMKFGGHGSGDGQFQFWNAKHEANGGYMALDAQGNIFVADTGNHRVQKFNHKGEFLTKWGKFGETDGEMNEPYAISTDTQGNVYVSDMLTKRVQKFDNNGKFIAVIAKPGPNSAGELPWLSHTVDRNGNIYVGTFGGQIHKFDSSGKQIPGWGDNIKIIRAVFHLVTDDTGNLYVSDARPRVVKIHAIGTLLGEFDLPNLEWPETAAVATALDSKGQAYIGFNAWNGKVWDTSMYAYQLRDLKPIP